MLVVLALGGNALLKRGEPMTAESQRANVARAAKAIAEVITAGHRVVVTHGNGPQVGLLALQNLAYRPDEAFPLDVLGAETEGMIGYLIEQELGNALPAAHLVATLLTQVEVDPADQAFRAPAKPIGPVYSQVEAERIANERNWTVARDGAGYRRVVASPAPVRILDVNVIRMLLERGVTVICGGGGGIPVVRRPGGGFAGIEAVIDKDRASGLLGIELGADALLMLTDVDSIYADWGTPKQMPIRLTTPAELRAHTFAAGSMGPKVEAACAFVEKTNGTAGIGALGDALAILNGEAGTRVGPAPANFDASRSVQ